MMEEGERGTESKVKTKRVEIREGEDKFAKASESERERKR